MTRSTEVTKPTKPDKVHKYVLLHRVFAVNKQEMSLATAVSTNLEDLLFCGHFRSPFVSEDKQELRSLPSTDGEPLRGSQIR